MRDLLADGRWKEADLETSRAMIQAAGRGEEGWLTDEDLDNFSCEDLRIIDQLWLESSQGKFGFSIQKDIYQNLGGTRKYNREIWENFATQVGWKQGDDWVKYSDLIYNLNAPTGQLPIIIDAPIFERVGGRVGTRSAGGWEGSQRYIFSRCGL